MYICMGFKDESGLYFAFCCDKMGAVNDKLELWKETLESQS